MKKINPNSKRQTFFKWIESQIENNIDLTDSSKRLENYELFLKENNFTKDEYPQNNYSKIFTEVVKKTGLNPVDYGLLAKKPESNIQSGFKSSVKDGSVPVQNVEVVSPETLQADIAKNATTPEQAKSGMMQINYDVKAVAGFWGGIYYMFKMFIPNLEDLTNDEKESLGTLWLPIFQKYLSTGLVAIITPLMTTAAIFGAKFVKLRKENEKKSVELKKQNETGDNKIEESNV